MSKSSLICIIDDQPTNLEILNILLQTQGYEVLFATSGEEGIEKIEKFLPDLILLDILMPNMDGFETCQRLKSSEKSKDIPIIFMSALNRTQDRVKGLELGAVDYITKPFEPQEVFARINNQLKVQQLYQELLQKNQLLHKEIEQRKQTELALIESEKKLKKILNTNINGILLVDEKGIILFSNPAAENLFGQSRILIGKNLGVPFSVGQLSELEIINSDNKLLTLEMSAVNIIWENKPAYLISLVDITERKKMAEKLNILFQASEQSPASIVITDTQGYIEYVNPKFEEISGYKKEEVLGQNPRILKSGDTNSENYKNLWQTITSGKEWHGEFHNRKKTGEFYWEKASISPIFNSQGIITNYIAVKEDITLKKNQDKLLEYQANYDNLTKIPNRNFALQRLDYLIKEAKNNQQNIGVMFVDLDRFKDINDTLGHEYGDELLKQASQRIHSILRKTDLVARLGGDEFLIIIPFIDEIMTLQIIAEKIISALKNNFLIVESQVFISASIGIAIYPDDGLNVKDLMRNADAAMFYTKKNGKNNYQFFNRQMNQAILTKIKLEKRLNLALEKSEFKLVYQPVVDINSGKIVSAEALIRWENDELGLISPQEFIPIAEDTGLIIKLGEWLLSVACQEAVTWQNNRFLSIAVNLSPRQFRDKNLLNFITQALASSKLNPSCLQLEITETLLLEEVPDIKKMLTTIHGLNIGLSLDDFGTGYSSLSYLSKYPFNTLKIDKSFVQDMVTDKQVLIVIKTIIAMAKALKLKIVAEGIETKSQLKLLADLGCHYGQGFLFSKPLNKDDFKEYLTKNDQIIF